MDYDIECIAASVLEARGDQCRFLVAIAGPPASGKSTLSKALSNYLNEIIDLRSVVVPMDGFHLDNDCLKDLKLLHRKGAPETFDFDSFFRLLRRLEISDQPIYYPIFDRALDKVIAGRSAVYPRDQVILVEGNYLLLDEQPWSQLNLLFDYSIFLDTPVTIFIRVDLPAPLSPTRPMTSPALKVRSTPCSTLTDPKLFSIPETFKRLILVVPDAVGIDQ